MNFEAVLRVEEEETNPKQNLTKPEVEDDLGLSMLIDSQNNQYILTKPRDATIPRADHHFIKVGTETATGTHGALDLGWPRVWGVVLSAGFAL